MFEDHSVKILTTLFFLLSCLECQLKNEFLPLIYFVLQYRIYPIKYGKYGTCLQFSLCDSMGIHEKEGVGLCMEDIPYILKGCVPDRYQVRILQSLKSFKSVSSMLFVKFLSHKAVSTVFKMFSTSTNTILRWVIKCSYR